MNNTTRPLVSTPDLQLYISPIIKDLQTLSLHFGSQTETIVNQAQRSFRALHRQQEWLTTKAMLWSIFQQKVDILHTPEGKPFISPSMAQNISISHSKTHVAILLTTKPHAGVDIELSTTRILKLQTRIVQADELPTQFQEYTDTQKSEYLTKLWTVKEAVYKSMDSQQDVDLLTDIRTTLRTPEGNPSQAFVKNLGPIDLCCTTFANNICCYLTY